MNSPWSAYLMTSSSKPSPRLLPRAGEYADVQSGNALMFRQCVNVQKRCSLFFVHFRRVSASSSCLFCLCSFSAAHCFFILHSTNSALRAFDKQASFFTCCVYITSSLGTSCKSQIRHRRLVLTELTCRPEGQGGGGQHI